MKKTESIGDFLARGGKITLCPTKHAKGGPKKRSFKTYVSEEEAFESQEPINVACLPAHIAISLGIKKPGVR